MPRHSLERNWLLNLPARKGVIFEYSKVQKPKRSKFRKSKVGGFEGLGHYGTRTNLCVYMRIHLFAAARKKNPFSCENLGKWGVDRYGNHT